MKQQFADYLYMENGGLDDISNIDETENVPETPPESSSDTIKSCVEPNT